MDDDLISIIVPAFNAEKLISKTLESIIGQQYNNLEIIVINDCSTDKTLEVINRFSSKDPRVNVIDLKENLGVHLARMEGIKVCKGVYIGFVDADDYIHPKMYESMLTQLKETDSCISVCSVSRVDVNGRHLHHTPKFRRKETLEENLVEKLTSLKLGESFFWNKLYKRDLIVNIPSLIFPWRQPLNEDMIVNIECFYRAKKVCVSNEVFYYYLNNELSATRGSENTKAYVEHVKAFAIALFLHKDKGQAVEICIYNFYRGYLAGAGLTVDNIFLIDNYSKDLDLVVDLLDGIDKYALVKLASRNYSQQVLNKNMLVKIIFKFLDKKIFKKNNFKYIE